MMKAHRRNPSPDSPLVTLLVPSGGLGLLESGPEIWVKKNCWDVELTGSAWHCSVPILPDSAR